MEEIRCCCANCYYTGCYRVADKLASCRCKDVKKDALIYDEVLKENRFYVKRNSFDEEVQCSNFMPEIEDTEIEYVTYMNVGSNCPFCGEVNTIDNADGEGNEIISCENCGKEYAVNWCIY